MKERIPVLAKEFGSGEIIAVFYFVEPFITKTKTIDVIRCVKVRHENRHELAKMLKKFRKSRQHLKTERPPMKRYNMLWLANQWTICHLHDGSKRHKRYVFKPNGAKETPWWITN